MRGEGGWQGWWERTKEVLTPPHQQWQWTQCCSWWNWWQTESAHWGELQAPSSNPQLHKYCNSPHLPKDNGCHNINLILKQKVMLIKILLNFTPHLSLATCWFDKKLTVVEKEGKRILAKSGIMRKSFGGKSMQLTGIQHSVKEIVLIQNFFCRILYRPIKVIL